MYKYFLKMLNVKNMDPNPLIQQHKQKIVAGRMQTESVDRTERVCYRR